MFSEDYESFTNQEKKILEKYVTNTESSIFALKNLPEVIKGALFSRYSRSTLGLRSLLLKEFIKDNPESSFESITGESQSDDDSTSSQRENSIKEQEVAIQKAQNFYDRILDGYGDDSIGELGGAHLAIENISMLAAKMLEDSRIGGSPLEKSTRYIYFDQKVNGEYLYYREPILMTSAFKEKYLNTCDHLFETYSKLIPPLTQEFELRYPKDEATSQGAYNAATRAKVLDCLRGLLPAGTLTNMGIFGNGRFYESLIHKLHCSNLAELQEIGTKAFDELAKIIPSFIRRSSTHHKTHTLFAEFNENISSDLKLIASHHPLKAEAEQKGPSVTLIDFDKEGIYNVAASLLYGNSNRPFDELLAYTKTLSEEELQRIFDAASSARETRRHKSPRALEHASFTFEIIADFGVYRDLHRHRLLTQERQLLNCDLGYYIPAEIVGTPLEKEYRGAMDLAKSAFDSIAKEFPEEAEYVVPMAYNVRWYFHMNLRALQWITELRSAAAGHPNYRYIAQCLAKETIKAVPSYERFFKFVDYAGYDLGRLSQEQKAIDKKVLSEK